MPIGDFDELRKRAEERLRNENGAFSENSKDELRSELHELRTHQIELELQNEELCRVQEELVETRDQYIDLYDFAPVGYLTLSDKNLIVEVNLTMADLLGGERESLINRPFSQFIVHEDQDIFYRHFKRLIDSKNRGTCELRLLRKDGEWFWARLECVPIEKKDKSGILIRIALHDITKSMRLESEIIKAQKLESTALLAGGIAHDFNNLLMIIIGYIEIARLDILHGRPAAKNLQDAVIACLRAGDLIKKFRTFAPGGIPYKTLTSVKTFITDTLSLVLAGSNIDSECSFADNLWPVEVDLSQLTQAVGNVITNARDAMPQGGTIRIRAVNVDSLPEKNRQFLSSHDAKCVKISIGDQGIGIPKELLPQVFDPYFSSKEMGQEKGVGLGLSIAYSIINKHGGSIEIASQQNIGTTVSIYLPASDKKIVSQEPLSRKVLPLNKKILVMDDEEMLRELTRHLLEELEYEVEVASDGEEALQIYAQAQQAGSPFGAVILDLTIKGGMGGEETLKRLKKFDPDIRAIVASGYSDNPVMANFREYGFIDALQKPYQLRDLKRALGETVDMTADS